ncbi:MAG TPA: hypothetical protein VFT84_12640 [Gemmatimonadales bacterium]|nr:hypothetical protein [Gemmatimonadales bacterium]
MTAGRGQMLAVGLSLLAATAAGAQSAGPPPASCTAPEYRQFDFWLGDWDTYELPDTTTVVARLQVTAMLGGCALRENYAQADGLVGESYSLWDAGRRVWHQSWVTNRGALLLLDGEFRNGRMVLTAEERRPDGGRALLRGTWWSEGGNVRQKAARSTDGGTRWSPAWDILFRPHTPR